MRQGIFDLRAFYASPLGAVARLMISRKVREVWPDAGGLDVLALGYATPFLDGLGGAARRVVAAMPAAQGVEAWPAGARSCACLTREAALPFPNALFDRILAVHALEESDDPVALLSEAHRVLAPSGRMILAVTDRRGLWADVESTPFGHGRTFSRRQLEHLVRAAQLTPLGWTRALYLPPIAWTARWGEGFEQVGSRLWPGFAGLILMEAAKHTFALRPKGRPARVPARPRPVFAPAPVSGLTGLGEASRREGAFGAGRTGPLPRASSPIRQRV
jgi:SAM-dependent methyltransferase